MDKISGAEDLSASKIDQLASSITIKEKRESVFIFLFSLFLLTFVYRKKPSAKAKYMLEAVAASRNDDWTPPPTRYILSCLCLVEYLRFWHLQ